MIIVNMESLDDESMSSTLINEQKDKNENKLQVTVDSTAAATSSITGTQDDTIQLLQAEHVINNAIIPPAPSRSNVINNKIVQLEEETNSSGTIQSSSEVEISSSQSLSSVTASSVITSSSAMASSAMASSSSSVMTPSSVMTSSSSVMTSPSVTSSVTSSVMTSLDKTSAAAEPFTNSSGLILQSFNFSRLPVISSVFSLQGNKSTPLVAADMNTQIIKSTKSKKPEKESISYVKKVLDVSTSSKRQLPVFVSALNLWERQKSSLHECTLLKVVDRYGGFFKWQMFTTMGLKEIFFDLRYHRQSLTFQELTKKCYELFEIKMKNFDKSKTKLFLEVLGNFLSLFDRYCNKNLPIITVAMCIYLPNATDYSFYTWHSVYPAGWSEYCRLVVIREVIQFILDNAKVSSTLPPYSPEYFSSPSNYSSNLLLRLLPAIQNLTEDTKCGNITSNNKEMSKISHQRSCAEESANIVTKEATSHKVGNRASGRNIFDDTMEGSTQNNHSNKSPPIISTDANPSKIRNEEPVVDDVATTEATTEKQNDSSAEIRNKTRNKPRKRKYFSCFIDERIEEGKESNKHIKLRIKRSPPEEAANTEKDDKELMHSSTGHQINDSIISQPFSMDIRQTDNIEVEQNLNDDTTNGLNGMEVQQKDGESLDTMKNIGVDELDWTEPIEEDIRRDGIESNVVMSASRKVQNSAETQGHVDKTNTGTNTEDTLDEIPNTDVSRRAAIETETHQEGSSVGIVDKTNIGTNTEDTLDEILNTAVSRAAIETETHQEGSSVGIVDKTNTGTKTEDTLDEILNTAVSRAAIETETHQEGSRVGIGQTSSLNDHCKGDLEEGSSDSMRSPFEEVTNKRSRLFDALWSNRTPFEPRILMPSGSRMALSEYLVEHPIATTSVLPGTSIEIDSKIYDAGDVLSHFSTGVCFLCYKADQMSQFKTVYSLDSITDDFRIDNVKAVKLGTLRAAISKNARHQKSLSLDQKFHNEMVGMESYDKMSSHKDFIHGDERLSPKVRPIACYGNVPPSESNLSDTSKLVEEIDHLRKTANFLNELASSLEARLSS